MVSRALVGGFMIFIGGLGLLGAPIACIGLALVLIGAAPLPASGFPEGLRWLLWGDVLIGLGISAMGIFASYFYLSGGIGIIQGRSAGAEKGGNAAALSLGLIGIRAVWAIFVVIVASQHAGDRGPGAGPIIVGILILALIVSVIPGALLLWCNSAGQRLPD